MATSKIRILNAAFLLLGQDEIQAIDNDSSKVIKRASALYDLFYSNFLCDNLWLFALKKFKLVKISDAEMFNYYNNAYKLPSDFLRAYSLEPYCDYKIYGNVLYSNYSDNLELYYTHYVKEDLLPVYYESYLIYKMAELLAMPITQKPDLAMAFANKSKMEKIRAITIDSQQQPSLVIKSNPILASKYGDVLP